MFLGIYNIPGLVSYMGLFLSVAACFLSLNGMFGYAVICFMFAGVCDLFDGFVARKLATTEEENIFGVQIDSIIDVVSFGLAPVIIGLHIGLNTGIDYIILTFYVSAAAMRLAYFNLLSINNRDKTPVKFYTGLPVTYSAMIFSLVFTLKLFVEANLFLTIVRISFVIVAFLFILKIKVPKPKGVFYVIFPLAAIGLTAFWICNIL